MYIDRSRIVDRVRRSEARLVSIVAPAGFGKSTAARAIAGERDQSIVCDAGGVTDVAHFARRVIRGLQAVMPERADALASDLYTHLQPGVTAAQIAGFILDACTGLDERKAVIFDNLESIADKPDCLDVLVRLIKACRHGLVILCARPPFALVNSRLIPPNVHLRLGIGELAFTRAEVAALIGADAGAGVIDRVTAITQGWPVVVLLFRQLARIGRLAPALERTAGSELDDLRDYLINEVLDSIRGPLYDALVALVATRPLGIDAIWRATGGAVTAETLRELAINLPLVSLAADGTAYEVHPLIASLVELRAQHDVVRVRRAAADANRAAGYYGEAARLYIDGGDSAAAAAALEEAVGPFIGRTVIPEFDEIVERLPGDLLTHYPRLWALMAVIRRGATGIDTLISEGLIALDLLPDPASLEGQQISGILVLLATQRGRFDLVDRLRAAYRVEEFDVSPGGIAILSTDTMHNVLMGRTQNAMDRVRFALPRIENELFRAYFMLRTEVVIATMDGRFDDALLAQLRILQDARSGGKSNLIAGMAQHQAVVAWLAGDDVRVAERFDEMRRTGATVAANSYEHFVAAWDTGAVDKLANAPPRMRAFTLLMIAGKTAAGDRRAAILAEALRVAGEARDVWAELLIVVAAALGDPAARDAGLKRAAALAYEVGREPLIASVASLARGGSGAPTLEALARRFDAVPGEADAAPPVVRVNVLSRTVYRGDQQLSISNRAISLIVALAVLGHVPRADLIALLWGVDELDAGTNALKMLVSRARRQLGDPGLIDIRNGVYVLRDDVVVDFHEIQRLVDSIAPNDPLTVAQRDALQAAYERFKPAWMTKESAPSIDAAISGVRHRVIERLSHDALDRGAIAEALAFADELRRRDGNDETAYELLIRAHVKSGNNAGALREYRIYSEHLQRDLGVQPSFTIEDLLQVAS